MVFEIGDELLDPGLQHLLAGEVAAAEVIAITAQICSGVYVAGAPERGASASRSDTDWAAGACRHRPRQYRTVFGHTSSSRALSRTPILSEACKIMRARNANCCEVEWARTSAS